MNDRIELLKIQLIPGIDCLEAEVIEKKKDYKHLSDIYQDSAKSENLVSERYAQVEQGIENYSSGICPHCGENAERHLKGLKKEFEVLTNELADKHGESELLSQRLLDIEIAINDLETQIHEGIRINKAIETEIAYLQVEKQESVAA